jgi:hypothetical protein
MNYDLVHQLAFVAEGLRAAAGMAHPHGDTVAAIDDLHDRVVRLVVTSAQRGLPETGFGRSPVDPPIGGTHGP